MMVYISTPRKEGCVFSSIILAADAALVLVNTTAARGD